MGIFLIMLIITYILFYLCRVIIGENNRIKIIFLGISGTMLAIVSGLRGVIVGSDTIQYYYAFQIINNGEYGWFDSKKTRYELGYFLINKIVGIFTDNPQVLIFTTSVVISIGICYFIYINSSNCLYSIILYQTMYYYCNSMNLSRQYIAVVIAINSYTYVKQKKTVKACCVVIMASLFHTSAFLMLPIVIVFSKMSINRKNIYTIISIITISLCGIPIIIKNVVSIFPRYEFYLTYSSSFNGGKVMPFIYLTMIFGGDLFISKIRNNSKCIQIYLESIYVFIGTMLLIIANIYFESASRITNYFLIYFIVYVPELFEILDPKLKKILYIGLVVFSTTYYIILIKSGVAGVYPFEFFWNYN